MKKRFYLKSIYTKFALIFLGIWWFLNSLTFWIVMGIMRNSAFTELAIDRMEFFAEFQRIRFATGLTFQISAVTGTIIILLAVRRIVKPIQLISEASKEVAKGNFNTQVNIKRNDEIGRLAADFNLMAKELRSIDTIHKDFVSNVSHEFKTPITSIKGFAKLIQEGQLSEEQLKEYSDTIVNESERLSLLSSNLLRLSELDGKSIREQGTKFALDEQLRKSILILEGDWTKKNIDFDIDLERITYWGDEHLLQQVWLNLIQNAIKFSHQNGVIRVSLQRQDGGIRVDIADQGKGISAADKEHIFDRFYKADKSRSREGNGLGLAIVKRIIELSGGRVSVESELDEGSIFTVELPCRL
ncbi:signal transduction histidine kinase [Desulfitobacterium dehalogenans ATCC 51507]|uniref:Heme sensor protein HssS n=1 Tax=Desulfitobacterium dehalogenans (strain ATCC 51507 / DSM 9161 / JW/IU-DC1) TaxID=756499 RepID=I4A4G1_DESDJ|nr:HAMP domain-containing sensor histidine kinase [Desulfitobacterium dehalogenans]AFL98845.1 signal transduction histidine kinase [Desulfitobacterium dehalogenans ATCC 51507]